MAVTTTITTVGGNVIETITTTNAQGGTLEVATNDLTTGTSVTEIFNPTTGNLSALTAVNASGVTTESFFTPGGTLSSTTTYDPATGATVDTTFSAASGGTVPATQTIYEANGSIVYTTYDASGSPASISTTQNGVTTTITLCFMAGTRVATPSGERKVEELAIGDPVLTADGRVVPVLWMARQTVSRRFADPLRTLPVRILAGALGENLPVRDLLLSPDHAVLVDGLLVQAAALVNGRSVVRETHVPETFVYYHVELEDHALILAEGLAAETFIDNASRRSFDNWEEHERLFPNGRSVPELALARVSSARQLPSSLVRRLSERADALVGAEARAA